MTTLPRVRWTPRAHHLAGYAAAVAYTVAMFVGMAVLMQLTVGRGQ